MRPCGAEPRSCKQKTGIGCVARRGLSQQESAATAAARPAAATARLSGAQAVGASGAALFAPVAGVYLTLNGAPPVAVAAACLSAAPLTAAAAAATGGALSARAIALAAAPLAVAAAWAAWSTGGATSPLAIWILVAVATAALFGGRLGAILAAALGLAIAAFLAFAPPPGEFYIAFRSRDEREWIAAGSIALAGLGLATTAWAAIGAWADALPALRHPTILARRALGQLAEESAACALRIAADGRVAQAVGAVERTLDLPRDQVKGMPLTAILHPDDGEAVAEHIAAAHNAAAPPGDDAPRTRRRRDQAAPTSTAFEPLTVRVKSRLGGYRWVEAAFVGADRFPRPVGLEPEREAMVVLRERWRPLQDDFGAGPREQTAFLAQMNDALRDELTEVVGYAEILKNELFGPLGGDRYREYARLAHDGGARLLERLEDLLDLAALEAGGPLHGPGVVDTAPVIDGAVRLVRALAEGRGVAVTAHIPADSPAVAIDRRALRRLLVTFLLDGIRQSQIGDQLDIRATVEDGAIRFAVVASRAHPDAHSDAGAALQEAASHGVPVQDDATPDDRRFGRLVARTLVDRLGGALTFFNAVDAAARDLGDAEERLLIEAVLPLDPGATSETAPARPKPIAAPKAKHASDARSAAPAARRRQTSGGAKGPSVVSPPTTTWREEGPLAAFSAEKQTEMARRFEEDLKRERADAGQDGGPNAGRDRDAASSTGPGSDDDAVDRPLFAPDQKRTEG